MKGEIPKNVITDSCFWIALYNKRDQYHNQAQKIYHLIEAGVILIPWPTLYETLNTRHVKNPIANDQFERFLKNPQTILIEDKDYKINALEATFRSSKRGRSISLVDMIIRLILADVNHKIDCLVTFNIKDFQDVCEKRKIPIFYE